MRSAEAAIARDFSVVRECRRRAPGARPGTQERERCDVGRADSAAWRLFTPLLHSSTRTLARGSGRRRARTDARTAPRSRGALVAAVALLVLSWLRRRRRAQLAENPAAATATPAERAAAAAAELRISTSQLHLPATPRSEAAEPRAVVARAGLAVRPRHRRLAREARLLREGRLLRPRARVRDGVADMRHVGRARRGAVGAPARAGRAAPLHPLRHVAHEGRDRPARGGAADGGRGADLRDGRRRAEVPRGVRAAARRARDGVQRARRGGARHLLHGALAGRRVLHARVVADPHPKDGKPRRRSARPGGAAQVPRAFAAPAASSPSCCATWAPASRSCASRASRRYTRVSGTALGGGTFLGLARLLTRFRVPARARRGARRRRAPHRHARPRHLRLGRRARRPQAARRPHRLLLRQVAPRRRRRRRRRQRRAEGAPTSARRRRRARRTCARRCS